MKTPEGLALRRSPYFHTFYYQAPHQLLKVKIGEKSTHALEGWGWVVVVNREVTILKYAQELSVLLNKSLPSRKSVLPVLNQHGFYQNLTISSPLCTSCLT